MKQQDSIELSLQHYPRAQDLSLRLCHCCGLLNSTQTAETEQTENKNLTIKCIRCHTLLHHRKPQSLDRTLALVTAAAILYIPANVMPMTITDSLFGSQQDTILTGVIYFWHSGDYFVASVIFCASIFIPMLKLLILFFLIIAVRLQSSKRWNFSPENCAKLYRLVEIVGKWSMIDVFVVALLTALIQIQSLATILAGPGAVAFSAVVVLTLLSSLSFDPRIIWDNYYAALSEKQKSSAASSEASTALSSNNTTIIKAQADYSLINNPSNSSQ